MFRDYLTTTPFSGPAPDSYFKERIWGDAGKCNDTTFVATLRAMLDKRMPEGDTLRFAFISGFPCADLKGGFGEDWTPNHNTFNYIGTSQSDDGYAEFAKYFLEKHPQFKEIEKIRGFFATCASVRCFVCEETKSVLFFADKNDSSRYHYYQCAALVCFPWYYNPKDGLSEDECALRDSLLHDSSADYVAALRKLAEGYDMESGYMRDVLSTFATSGLRRQRDATKSDLTNIEDAITRLWRDIADYMKQKETLDAKLFGLSAKIREGNDDGSLADYFVKNPSIKFVSLENGLLTFDCFGPVTYYDEDYAEELIRNQDSNLYFNEDNDEYYSDTGDTTADEIENLMAAIFLDRTIKLNFFGRFSLNGFYVDAHSGIYLPAEYPNYMPNPHIFHHACIDGHRPVIQRALEKYEYIPAIEQCIASAENLNFSDYVVMDEFMQKMWGCDTIFESTKAFILPDGTAVDRKGALEYLGK